MVGIKDIQVKELNVRNLKVSASLEIENPNSVGLDLSRTSLSIYTEGKLIGTIDQTHDTEMPAKSVFDLPIDLHLELSKLYDGDIMKALELGNKIMTERQISITISGYLYAGKDQIKLKVPIDREEIIEL